MVPPPSQVPGLLFNIPSLGDPTTPILILILNDLKNIQTYSSYVLDKTKSHFDFHGRLHCFYLKVY